MSFDVSAVLRELARPPSSEVDLDQIRLRASRLRRRRRLQLSAVAVTCGVLLLVAFVLISDQRMDVRQNPPAAGEPAPADRVTDSGIQGDTRPCKWGGHFRPYLTSLLVEIGGPEGATIRNSMLVDTGTGLRLDAPQYERGLLDVFVTADKFDLESDNTQGMDVVGREQSFILFRSTSPESDVVIAASDELGWTLSLGAYPRAYSLRWAAENAPVHWMRDAVDYMETHSLPTC